MTFECAVANATTCIALEMERATDETWAMATDILQGYPPWAVLQFGKLLDMVLRGTWWRTTSVATTLCPFEWCAPHWAIEHNLIEVLVDLTTYPEFLQQQAHAAASAGTAMPATWILWYRYAFETTNSELSRLSQPMALCMMAVLIVFLRIVKWYFIPQFSNMGRRAGRSIHGPAWEAKNEARIQKFGEYVFRLIFHGSITLYGYLYCVRGQEWWDDTNLMWINYPLDEVRPSMAWYFLWQGAYNVEALSALMELSFVVMPIRNWIRGDVIRWSPTVRGDFREMVVHHVATNFLVIGSSAFNMCRIGSMAFWLHDVSDVPVDMSKLANFLKFKTATALCFGTMVLCWLIFRLGYFPFKLYRASLMEAHLMIIPRMDLETGERTLPYNVPPIMYAAYKRPFMIFMGMIILLHVLWFSMFIKMGYLLIFKGETHDLSEHKKGEDQQAIPTTTEEEKEGEEEPVATTNGTNGQHDGHHQNNGTETKKNN